jgi:hypothetical protein
MPTVSRPAAPDVELQEELLAAALRGDHLAVDDLRAQLGVLDAPERGWLQKQLLEQLPGHPWIMEVWAARSL